jgi:hypothetical protein
MGLDKIIFVSPQERKLQEEGTVRVVSMEMIGSGIGPLFPPGFRFYLMKNELLSFYLLRLLIAPVH